MDRKKYIDMAYSSPAGKVWLRTLHKKEVWARWLEKVAQIGLSNREINEYADAIVVAAIWYLGYSPELKWGSNGLSARCIRRLRGGGPEVGTTDEGACGIPREFYVLDDFLEYEVRHLIPYKV